MAGEAWTALRYDVADAVATVTLDRPDALNALDATLKRELLAAVRSAARDPGVRVVVLTGAGRAFCAGQDLRETAGADATPLSTVLREAYNPLILAMRRLDKPIVAAVNGVAAGAGAALALAADLRIAADSASFVLAFGRVGLVPDSGSTWFLPRLVAGAGRGARVLGDPLPAAEAERWGLSTGPCRRADLWRRPRPAGRLAAAAPRARPSPAGPDRLFEATLEDQLNTRPPSRAWPGARPTIVRGVAAFLEKRPPRFTGE
jgi:2-(1,2-epoxy-1,2-dihydrophenyl)acetyl-CoA isomerase